MASEKNRLNSPHALLVTAVLIYYFSSLSPMTTPGNYFFLVAASLFTGIVIWLEPKIALIDFIKLRLTLRKVEKLKDEIFRQFIEIISYQSAISPGSWKNREKTINKLDLMLKELGVEKNERNIILENPRAIMKMMKGGKEKLNRHEKQKVDELFNLDD